MAWTIVLGILMVGAKRITGKTTAPTPQTAQSTAGAVLGTGAFTSFVENMDRSLAFYHDAFGMDVPALPATGEGFFMSGR
jgi:hypothetical protein